MQLFVCKQMFNFKQCPIKLNVRGQIKSLLQFIICLSCTSFSVVEIEFVINSTYDQFLK